jgi:hypothetical protein
MAAKLLTFVCSECGKPVGVMPFGPFLCPRTRRMAQPHTPIRRRTPVPLAVLEQQQERRERERLARSEARARKRQARTRRLTVTVEWPTGA